MEAHRHRNAATGKPRHRGGEGTALVRGDRRSVVDGEGAVRPGADRASAVATTTERSPPTSAASRSHDLGSQDGITIRIGLAVERMRAGDLAGARRDIGIAERAAWQSGQPPQQIEVMAALMELYRRSGEVEQADRELDRMERVALESPLPRQRDQWLHVGPARMANLLTAGDAKRARELLPHRAIQAALATCPSRPPAAGQVAAVSRATWAAPPPRSA